MHIIRCFDKVNVKCKILYLLIISIGLTGCGLMKYRTEYYKDGKKEAEVISNIPAKVKDKDIEIEQKPEKTIIDQLKEIVPDTVKIEKD